MKFVVKWVDLEGMVLSEAIQGQKSNSMCSSSYMSLGLKWVKTGDGKNEVGKGQVRKRGRRLGRITGNSTVAIIYFV